MGKYETLKKILGSTLTVAMARGTVVVDENLLNLIPHLKDKNIRVYNPPAGLKDDTDQFKQLIANRIFVTANPRDFIKYAPELDCGLISVEHLFKKDPPDVLAAKISEALRELKLFSQRQGFLLVLKDGEPEFKTFE